MHLYDFEHVQSEKNGKERLITSHELKDGTTNLETFLFAQNIVWDEQWNGLKEVTENGTEWASIPKGDEKIYFEDSRILHYKKQNKH